MTLWHQAAAWHSSRRVALCPGPSAWLVKCQVLAAVGLRAWQHTLYWAPCLASGLHAGLLLASLHHLTGSVLGSAGFLQAWLGGGLREQVLACVEALLKELEPDQRCTILLTGKQFCLSPA